MPPKTNIGTTVTDRLRSAILNGEIPPRARLRLDELRNTYQVSLSPVREALLRLAGENLVVGETQRGFSVAETSVENLEEVMMLRRLIEPYALGMAMQRGTVEWEEKLVGVFHRLNRLEDQESKALEDWEAAHREFHLTLLRACGMPMVLEFCERLYDLADRYRRLYLKKHPPQRNVKREHADILDKVIARDPKACELLTQHIERTTSVVIEFMRSPTAKSSPRKK